MLAHRRAFAVDGGPAVLADPSRPYDPARDVTPITLVSWSPLALVANTGLGVESVRDLIALAKTRTLYYGSSGAGSGGHMSVELLKSMTGMNATHVPYKGAAAATNDVVAGHVQFEIVGPVTVVSLARAGRLKLLADRILYLDNGNLTALPSAPPRSDGAVSNSETQAGAANA